MRIAGEATVQAQREAVWGALLDPAVLVRTIPGCERLETVGENSYSMTVTVGIAAIRGTYSGACTITDLQPHDSLKLKAEGAGAPGTIAADVDVRFSEDGTTGFTVLQYDADTTVGGMIGGVGQRMLSSVPRRLAVEFFTAIEQVLVGGPTEAAAASPSSSPSPAGEPAATPGVFTAPPKAASTSSQRDFLTGVAVGAGLVAFGVVLGTVAGRRR